MSWGIRLDALLGCAWGVRRRLSGRGVQLEDAVRLVAERAHRIDALPPGADAGRTALRGALGALCWGRSRLAAVNGPGVCVAAGPPEAVAALEARLAGEDPGPPAAAGPGLPLRWMEPAAAELTRPRPRDCLSPPRIPIVSNVTGTWLTPAESPIRPTGPAT